ncbi:hypothetical protein B0H14DRAFT_2128 [Mycena olivaceomarginata]|nr:hypothetical protein B0H14DRAFT_2128 [Mycena olivaceomarginata]
MYNIWLPFSGWHHGHMLLQRSPFYFHHLMQPYNPRCFLPESSSSHTAVQHPRDVAIFWDYGKNCHASSQVSGYEIVSAIRNVAHRFGPVKHFKAYLEVPGSDGPRSLNLRSELQSSGVSLT